MKAITKFEAFDGEVFPTQEECIAHEASCVQMRLIGLTGAPAGAGIAMTSTGRPSQEILDLVYSALPPLGAAGTTPAAVYRAVGRGAKSTARNAMSELIRQGKCVRFGADNDYRYFRAPQEQP